MAREFKAFSDYRLIDFLDNYRNEIKLEIESESEDYILNTNQIEYINHIVEKFEIEKLFVDFEKAFVSDFEKEIPSDNFPNNFMVYSGKTYKKSVLKYFLPFEGNHKLLRYQASIFNLSNPIISIEDNFISFEIINFENNVQLIKNVNNSLLIHL